MNKTDFLENLKKGLGSISGNERQSVLDYYDEMISDGVENGKTEEEAVAELGSPESVVENILAEFAVSGEKNMKKYEKTERKVGIDGKRKLKVKCEIEKINVTATDGNEIVFTYYEGKKLQHDLTDKDGEVVLETRDKSWFFRNRFGLDEEVLTIDVAVPREFSGDLILEAATGAINVRDLLCIKDLKAEASTGSVCAENLKAEKATFATSTGSVTVSGAEILGDAEIKASTGSVKAENFKAGGHLAMSVTTGSLKCDAEAAKLTLKSTTGGVNFSVKNADEIYVKCTTGSVKGTVSGVKSEYDIHSSTIIGKSNLAERTGTAGKKLTVITTTGSINVNFE